MYNKIDLFINGTYYCSTNFYRTCREAKLSIKKKLQSKSKLMPNYVEDIESIKISAFFDKSRR